MLLAWLTWALALTLILSRAGFRSAPGTAVPSPLPPVERILVIGATGGSGREIVRQALERGLSVTALVRNPARLDLSHPRLRVLTGDVLDAESVTAAMTGQQAVLCALGHKRFFYPNRILSRGTENILQAMTAHGTRRLICETSMGIGDSAGRLGPVYTLFLIPLILPFYFLDKTRQERLVAASDRDWTIVRPAALTNAPACGTFRHGHGVGSFILMPRVARADVAAFMLDQLSDNAYLRRAPSITA